MQPFLDYDIDCEFQAASISDEGGIRTAKTAQLQHKRRYSQAVNLCLNINNRLKVDNLFQGNLSHRLYPVSR